MYSQGLIGADGKTTEDEAFIARFLARVDREEERCNVVRNRLQERVHRIE